MTMKKTDKQLIFSKLFPDEESCIRYYEDKDGVEIRFLRLTLHLKFTSVAMGSINARILVDTLT